MDADQDPGSVKDFAPRRSLAPLLFAIVVALIGAAVGSLFMPVCVPIPEAELPQFETVVPLADRAARGEGFEKKGKHWYQCKTRIARMFF